MINKLKKYIICLIIGISLYYIVNTLCNCNSGFNIGAEDFGELKKTDGPNMARAKLPPTQDRYFKIEDDMIFIYKDENHSKEAESSGMSICNITHLQDEPPLGLKHDGKWWYFKFYYQPRKKYYYIWHKASETQTDLPIHRMYASIKSIRSTGMCKNLVFIGIFNWGGMITSSEYYVYLNREENRIIFYEGDPFKSSRIKEYSSIYKRNIVSVDISIKGPYLDKGILDQIIVKNDTGDKIRLYFHNPSDSVEYTEFHTNSRTDLDTYISQLNDLLPVNTPEITVENFEYYITIVIQARRGDKLVQGRRLLKTKNVDDAFWWLDPLTEGWGALDARLERLLSASDVIKVKKFDRKVFEELSRVFEDDEAFLRQVMRYIESNTPSLDLLEEYGGVMPFTLEEWTEQLDRELPHEPSNPPPDYDPRSI